ncbi:hypothetical protein ACNFIA_03460 [Pseudomonas sp. NY15437]|uniref:hypothetical protein n=1 Tax=unclassified Pseudomonas TaxID=196821 RepID=UPI00223C2888|nr:hypothetical protein [Pseudomonas sp. GCEP-101]
MKHSHSRLAFLLMYCGSGQEAGKTGTGAASGSMAQRLKALSRTMSDGPMVAEAGGSENY